MDVIALLKKIPIDLGQQTVAEWTEGKQIALRLVPDGHGKRALDVGAREGHQTRWLQGRGYEVTSVDVEPLFPECIQVDANKRLPFDDAQFDLIWCSEVIEHLNDPVHAMSELRRISKPGAHLILTTPNSYAWLFRFIALFGLTPQRIQRKDHVQFFDFDDVLKLAPDADFYGYFPYMLVKKTIRRGIGALSPTFVLHIRKSG
ncbi:MAG TPA: class I SAM-dependent methyltransferase [Polyangiaceae bacterium]|jgi:SAM-dependent methyltransferase|nr:class I SAM-dependent methyltransferase [Polyangiaceae bacterium]